MIIIPTKWLFHWEYILFSDKPTWHFNTPAKNYGMPGVPPPGSPEPKFTIYNSSTSRRSSWRYAQIFKPFWGWVSRVGIPHWMASRWYLNHDEPIQATKHSFWRRWTFSLTNETLIWSKDGIWTKRKDRIWSTKCGIFCSQPGIFHWTNEHWSILLSSTGKNWRRSPKSSCLHTVVHHLCASLQVGSLSLEAFLACISNSQDVKRTIFLVGNIFSQHVFRLTALRVHVSDDLFLQLHVIIAMPKKIER